MKRPLWINRVDCETAAPKDSKLGFLIVLVLIDLVVIGLNFYNSWIPDDQWSEFLAIGSDNSIGEYIQYVKWLLITVLFVSIGIKRSDLNYLSWALLFAYLLADDSLGLHENIGEYLVQFMNFIPSMGGLRLQDIGELLVSAIAGSVLLLVAIWAYKTSDEFYKVTTKGMFILFIILVLFGVVFDVVAVMIYTGNVSAFIYDVIEDGGEMFVASFMFWYIIIVSKAESLPITLADSLRSLVKLNPSIQN